MAVEIRYSGQTVHVASVNGNVAVRSPSYTVSAKSGLISGAVPYTGAYEADALFSTQVFPTAQKTMRSDFTVNAINYTEAPNETGITLTIGG